MPIDLDTLNENQRKAVMWEDGPLLVLAGPGSGKTRVLTLRVARLLEEREDVSVLALTFTDKAAAEMRERVDHLLGQRGDRAQLCTFHSFAGDVLRQHGSHLGLSPDFTLLTLDEDRVALLNEIVPRIGDETIDIPPDRKSLLVLLDRMFAESYDGGPKAPSLLQTPQWLPELFAAYGRELIATNRLDFGGLLHFARKLLRENHGVGRVLRLGWTHVCVDEFQDTNKAQYDLLRLLVAEKHPNLFVVGDDDQILYQWNGASPERLLALRSDYETELVQLPENYRCPLEIVELANKLIVHNQLRTENKKPLTASRPAGLDDKVVRYGAFSTPEDEVRAIVKDIQSRGLAPADCVVLARTTKLLELMASDLRSAGYEAHVAQRKNDFNAPVVRVVFNSLRLANARHDRDILRRLCVAWEALTDRSLEVEDLAASAALIGGDFLRAWADSALVNAAGDASDLLGRIRTALVDRLDFCEIVDWFLGNGWNPWSNAKDQELADEVQTWQALHDEFVREYGEDNLTLNVYLQKMDLAPKTARPGPNSFRCMTVHGSKGMEFKHVYLIGMAQEVLPSFQSLKKGTDSRDLEEERRNCFVAITRTQTSLTLTRSREYNGWPKGPSQFLLEMGLEEKA